MDGRSVQAASDADCHRPRANDQDPAYIFDIRCKRYGSRDPRTGGSSGVQDLRRVSEIMVQEGDRVDQGQVLAGLETANLEQAFPTGRGNVQIGPAQLPRPRQGASRRDRGGRRSAGQCPGWRESRRKGCRDRPGQRGGGSGNAGQFAGYPEQTPSGGDGARSANRREAGRIGQEHSVGSAGQRDAWEGRAATAAQREAARERLRPGNAD